jgi:ferredoxin
MPAIASQLRTQSASSFSARPLPYGRCRTASLVVRAEEPGFCRDKVAFGTQVAVEGESKIVFLGAGGSKHELMAKKVINTNPSTLIKLSFPTHCAPSTPLTPPPQLQDTYILDSGLDAGLELPFTCRGGICGACVGRVVSGEVDMSDVPDLTFTVSEAEAAKGMALLCMARPVSDEVHIETQSDWGYSLGVAEWQGATGHINGKTLEPLMGKKWEKFTTDETSS